MKFSIHHWTHEHIFVLIMLMLASVSGLLGLMLIMTKIQDLDAQKGEYHAQAQDLDQKLSGTSGVLDLTEAQLASVSALYQELANEDQYLRNNALEATIGAIEKTYVQAADVYEELVKLKELKPKDTSELDDAYSEALVLLSDRDYSGAAAELKQLSLDIATMRQEIVSSFQIPVNTPSSNTPPDSGYSRQQVSADVGTYLVSMVAADLSSTKVVIVTAAESDCANDCPVKALGQFVSENGAFAGVNGSYFCPASYPSCAGKTNSFDTLLMNVQKKYFNSDNNVYSSVPIAIFGSGYARFEHASSSWGRDTGVDGVIANQPLLVKGGQVVFGGDGDPKKGSKSGRGFVANKGNTIYIGVVHNATVAESARVMQALGMENALNLDGGGSTALWSGGYKVGPGRNLANAVLLVRR